MNNALMNPARGVFNANVEKLSAYSLFGARQSLNSAAHVAFVLEQVRDEYQDDPKFVTAFTEKVLADAEALGLLSVFQSEAKS